MGQQQERDKERVALFAGSFDPFTIAHERIVIEALNIFDRVVIGVGCNISKSYLLTTERRRELICEVFRAEPRVRVELYDGLTTTFAHEVGATALIRGVRGSADLEAERVYNAVNSRLAPDLTTVLLFTPDSMNHISSSCVRELLHFGERECAQDMMPSSVSLEAYLD